MDLVAISNGKPNNTLPPNKGIIAINLFEISNSHIKEVQTKLDEQHWITDVLPEYLLVDGIIYETSDYFDDVDFCLDVLKADKIWTMFDVEYTHPIFEYEINNFGFLEFMLEIELADYLKKLKAHSEHRFSKNYYHGFPTFVLIQHDVISHYDHYSGGNEYETIMQVLGHFNENFELQKNEK